MKTTIGKIDRNVMRALSPEPVPLIARSARFGPLAGLAFMPADFLDETRISNQAIDTAITIDNAHMASSDGLLQPVTGSIARGATDTTAKAQLAPAIFDLTTNSGKLSPLLNRSYRELIGLKAETPPLPAQAAVAARAPAVQKTPSIYDLISDSYPRRQKLSLAGTGRTGHKDAFRNGPYTHARKWAMGRVATVALFSMLANPGSSPPLPDMGTTLSTRNTAIATASYAPPAAEANPRGMAALSIAALDFSPSPPANTVSHAAAPHHVYKTHHKSHHARHAGHHHRHHHHPVKHARHSVSCPTGHESHHPRYSATHSVPHHDGHPESHTVKHHTHAVVKQSGHDCRPLFATRPHHVLVGSEKKPLSSALQNMGKTTSPQSWRISTSYMHHYGPHIN